MKEKLFSGSKFFKLLIQVKGSSTNIIILMSVASAGEGHSDYLPWKPKKSSYATAVHCKIIVLTTTQTVSVPTENKHFQHITTLSSILATQSH
jgi:hypothetical protein